MAPNPCHHHLQGVPSESEAWPKPSAQGTKGTGWGDTKSLSVVAKSTCEWHHAQLLTLSSRFLDVFLSCKHLNSPGKPSLHSMAIFTGHSRGRGWCGAGAWGEVLLLSAPHR